MRCPINCSTVGDSSGSGFAFLTAKSFRKRNFLGKVEKLTPRRLRISRQGFGPEIKSHAKTQRLSAAEPQPKTATVSACRRRGRSAEGRKRITKKKPPRETPTPPHNLFHA